MTGTEGEDVVERTFQPVDLLLGEGSAEERAAFRKRLGADPELALEMAETVTLFEELREVRCGPPPSPKLALRLEQIRHAAWQRHQRRVVENSRNGLIRLRSRGVAAAAAAMFVGLALLDPLGLREDRAAETRAEQHLPAAIADAEVQTHAERVAAAGGRARTAVQTAAESDLLELIREEPVLPVSEQAEPRLHRAWDKFKALRQPDVFDGWLTANNDLQRLQWEYRHRFSTEMRRRVLHETGGNPDVDDRVQDLAAAVAEGIDERLRLGDATVLETSLALRALLAAGSTARLGRHREQVRRCAEWLTAAVTAPELEGRLHGGPLASALTALLDLAVCSPGKTREVVREHSLRLAMETVSPEQSGRSGLLEWGSSPASLGDAGRLFQLAPAFGVHPTWAFRARLVTVTHLQERIDDDGADRPALLAAQLYGFADLVDRDRIDHQLRLWRTVALRPDFVALHHLAWSRFPARLGWARFQQDLRALSTEPTPSGAGDRAALLLCLAMNFAAPGHSELMLAED